MYHSSLEVALLGIGCWLLRQRSSKDGIAVDIFDRLRVELGWAVRARKVEKRGMVGWLVGW